MKSLKTGEIRLKGLSVRQIAFSLPEVGVEKGEIMVLRGEKRTQILRKKETTKTSTETALTIIAMKAKTGNLTRTGEIILIVKTTGPTTMTRTTLTDEKTID